MSKLSLSLIALLALSLPAYIAPTYAVRAAPPCNTDHPCTPDIPDDPKDPGNPGNPDNPGKPDAPGDPGNNKPFDPHLPADPHDVADNDTHQLLIACRVSGDPKALPDDLRFRNIGDWTIPQGTRVVWIVKESGDHGVFIVPVDLPPGKEVSEEDILKQGVPKTDHCLSKIQ